MRSPLKVLVWEEEQVRVWETGRKNAEGFKLVIKIGPKYKQAKISGIGGKGIIEKMNDMDNKGRKRWNKNMVIGQQEFKKYIKRCQKQFCG